MSRRRVNWRKIAGLTLLGAALIIAGAFVFDDQLLRVSSPLQPADAIVVLGGEPVGRVQAAANLVTNGFAGHVVVSGEGDCENNRLFLERCGVPGSVIELECDSQTTQQNAEFSVKRLRARGCKRVLIVTSWYHSRRALNTFRRYAPEIEFLSAPAARTQAWRYERSYIMAEYAKTIWYAVRYGIWPVTAN